MKTILKEIEFATDFCFQCKDYDYYNGQEYKELQMRKGAIQHVIFDHKKYFSSVESIDDAKKNTEVEEMLEYISLKPMFKCPKLQEAKISIDLDRELDMPDTEEKALRCLDRFANLCFAECPFSRTHLTSLAGSVKGRTLITLAKLDFALLEQGIDMVKLNDIIDLYYYEREEHIKNCGYSRNLIDHYIDKHRFEPITLSRMEELLGIPDKGKTEDSKIPEVFRTPEAIDYFKRLVAPGFCSDPYTWIDKSQKVIMCQVAHIISGLLKIPGKRKWKPFEDLWEVERLAQSYNKRNGRALDKEILELYPEYKGR